MPNLYEILGVAKWATPDKIKQAYREKAKQLHPDCGGNASDFELLAWAYRILSSPEKREQYDTLGTADDRTEDGKTSEAWTMIAGLLNIELTNVSDYTKHDLVGRMRAQLEVARIQTEKQISEVEFKIARYEDAQKRFRVSDGNNRIAQLIAGDIDSMRKQVCRWRTGLETAKLAREILSKYSYDHDPTQSVVKRSSRPSKSRRSRAATDSVSGSATAEPAQ